MKTKARRRVARMFGVRAAVVAALAGIVEAQQAVRQTDVQALNDPAKRFAERFRVAHAAGGLYCQSRGCNGMLRFVNALSRRGIRALDA